ncbi:EscF/YscF/HrpA family type III secretion system needle major subunit [Shigella flexneri]|uniref:EscF/YscF/HrpA family type III secretion system needle major subunit n=1 Tax=Shigella flexneri TaxID=623 RepID=UPI000B0BDD71|nr:EscF/YscF/HrpA family type III secretion system needle major subunit [Shigella flexneri]PNP05673.1 EscF/YscF/HrpA family type III secretion system needle major subunit [Shigella flexneri]
MSVTVPDKDWTLSHYLKLLMMELKHLQGQLTSALNALAENPSNPQLLLNTKVNYLNIHYIGTRQSNTVKVIKDVDAAIIQNFR